MDCSIILGSNLTYVSWFVKMFSNFLLKLTDLCKSTREHDLWSFNTLYSYENFLIFWLFPILIFASFWNRFWRPFWLVWGSTFGVSGDQKVSNMSSKIDSKIGIEKNRFWEGMTAKRVSRAGGQEVPPYTGGLNLPPWAPLGLSSPWACFYMTLLITLSRYNFRSFPLSSLLIFRMFYVVFGIDFEYLCEGFFNMFSTVL